MKVVSVPCPECAQDVACPTDQAGQPVRCPSCKKEVVFSHDDLGVELERKRSLPIWARRTLAAGPLAVALVLGAFILPEKGTGPAVKSPPLTMRCADCDRSFREDQADWEAAVKEALSGGPPDVEGAPKLPELVPLRCTHCGKASAYRDTILVRQAGLLSSAYETEQ